MPKDLLRDVKEFAKSGEPAIDFPTDDIAVGKLKARDRNLLALIQTAQSFLQIFPSERRPDGNEVFAFASLMWNLRRRTFSEESIFSPEVVAPAAITYIDALASGRVRTEFKDKVAHTGSASPQGAFIVQLHLKYNGSTNHYAETILSSQYADRVVSPKQRVDTLASFFASAYFVYLMEDERLHPTIEKEPDEDPVMPLLKKSVVHTIPEVLVQHQGFRSFYEAILKMEQNPY